VLLLGSNPSPTLQPALEHGLGDFELLCSFVRLHSAQWITRLLALDPGVLCPIDSSQFELAGVGFAMEGMSFRVREIVVPPGSSLGLKLGEKKGLLS
jgi:hypothetical protein